MKSKMVLGFCLLFVLVVWNVNAANVTIVDPKLEVALREALETADGGDPIAGGPHGGSWLPPIAQGSIDSAALSDSAFNIDLDISNLGITSLAGLEACTELTGLNASGNAITSLSYGTGADAKSVLGGLTNATSINLSNNLITSLTYAGVSPNVYSVLADLDACTELNLSNNKIVNLAYAPDTTAAVAPAVLEMASVLDDVVLCENLNLSNNLIVVLSYHDTDTATDPKLSVFDKLTVLDVLNLNNNLIASPTEFSYIGISTSLTELYVSNNKIAGVLPNITSLVDLVKLQLNGNLITDFSKLDPTKFPDLVYLDVSNNAGASIGIRRINPAVGGTTLTVEIDVASVPTLYGISFKLHFDSTANVTASSGSVVGSVLGTPLISQFTYPAAAATSGDVGVSISKQGLSSVIANGKLATINLLLTAVADDVKLTFEDVNALTSTGASIAICIPPLASYVIAKSNADYVTVCPGDTDNTGTVTVADLTGIANCYGYHADTGLSTARLADDKTPAQSSYLTTWFPQVAPIGTAGAGLWVTSLDAAVGNADAGSAPVIYSSTKAARADCNGDGIVDEKDVLVVALNFGKLAAGYTPPTAPSRFTGYSLPVLNELLDSVKSMPKSEARQKMIAVLKDTITQTQRAFVPKENVILQNYPNPFNPETWLPFQLVKDANVSVRIFDANGKMVRSLELGRKTAGSYLSKDLAAYWDGKTMNGEQVSSGVYFYNIQAGDYSATRKMIVNK
jgi:Leucine-rich repeat (LRR) protein